eukprot:scaffold172_cov254-Pinguiococcus_pyrenoidosus.AAC.6
MASLILFKIEPDFFSSLPKPGQMLGNKQGQLVRVALDVILLGGDPDLRGAAIVVIPQELGVIARNIVY